jgi:hypothetical protein
MLCSAAAAIPRLVSVRKVLASFELVGRRGLSALGCERANSRWVRRLPRVDTAARHIKFDAGVATPPREAPIAGLLFDLCASAVSALMLPCVQQAQVRPVEATPCCPWRTRRAVGAAALTQRPQRSQSAQRRQGYGASRKASNRGSSRSSRRVVNGIHLAPLADAKKVS